MGYLAEQWVTETLVTDMPSNISMRRLRLMTQRLGNAKYTHHMIARDSQGKYAIISAKEAGYALPIALRQIINRPGRWIYIERHEQGTYGLAVEQGRLVEQWSLDQAHHQAYSQVYIPKFLAEEGTLLLAEDTQASTLPIDTTNLPVEVVEPVFDRLKLMDRYALTGPERLRPPQALVKVAGVALSLLVIGGWIALSSYGSAQAEMERAREANRVDLMAPFKKALTETAANVKMQMARLYFDLGLIETTLTGWDIERVMADGKSTTIELNKNGGNFKQLEKWAANQGYLAANIQDAYTIAIPLTSTPVLQEPVLAPVDGIATYIRESVDAWWDEVKVKEQTAATNKSWVERVLNVNVANWTRHDFDTLGSLVNGLPVGFTRTELTKGAQGYTGQVTLTIYGN